jgi:hypothetical protein
MLIIEQCRQLNEVFGFYFFTGDYYYFSAGTFTWPKLHSSQFFLSAPVAVGRPV